MKATHNKVSWWLMAALAAPASASFAADSIVEAVKQGKAKVDLRIRHEGVDQDNALRDAESLTLRTRLNFTSADFKGFSAVLEFEDVRAVGGIDDYSLPPTGKDPGVYSIIPDPETTEMDQGYLQYRTQNTKVKLGRQVITFDNHRFVGDVGWRQDRQTFNAFGVEHKFNKKAKAEYYYVTKRNRIFAEDADLNSKDHFLNVSYRTGLGKLTGYAYLLELDNGSDNGLDSYGLRFVGARKLDSDFKLLYQLEYATQKNETPTADYDADYWLFEAGLGYTDMTLKLGLETLGSDNGNYGFSTPLSTLHKFNGWADIFLNTPQQGLEDVYIKFLGKALGGKFIIAWHDYSADDGIPGMDNYGSELEFQYTYAFSENYSFGLRYANYDADDLAVDTDKLWLWLRAVF